MVVKRRVDMGDGGEGDKYAQDFGGDK